MPRHTHTHIYRMHLFEKLKFIASNCGSRSFHAFEFTKRSVRSRQGEARSCRQGASSALSDHPVLHHVAGPLIPRMAIRLKATTSPTRLSVIPMNDGRSDCGKCCGIAPRAGEELGPLCNGDRSVATSPRYSQPRDEAASFEILRA